MSNISEKSRFSPFLKQCFITSAVCANIVGHGCMLGFPAILLPQLHQPDSPIPLTKENDSWLASVIGIMTLIGTLVILPLMGYSRKITHLIIIAPAIAGWTSIIFATTFWTLFLGPVLNGLSFGMHASFRSVQIGEYTSPKSRGAFLATVTLAQGFGVFFVHLMGSLLPWKTTATICVFFPITSFIMSLYFPESPIWLASKGRFQDCRQVFRWLRGDDENEELEAMIQAKIILDKEDIARGDERNILRSTITTIKKREFYKPIILMIHCMGMANFNGLTILVAYATKVLLLIMGPEANVGFWMIFLDTQRIFSSMFAIYVINKFKRRTMMFSSGVMGIICLLGLAAYVTATEGMPSRSIWIPAVLINIQVFNIVVGLLPLSSVIAGEVYPIEYKGIGGMITMTFSSAYFFTVLKTFPLLVDGIGVAFTYVIYAAVLGINLVIIWFLLPETKGKTLQEIEEEFRGRPLDPGEMESRKSLQEKPDLRAHEFRRLSQHAGSAGLL